MSKATNGIFAGFLFGLGVTAAYKLMHEEQKDELKEKVQAKADQAKQAASRVQDNLAPYVSKAKETLAAKKVQLANQVVDQEDQDRNDIEISEHDLSLNDDK
jgi:hypothetical protein